MHTREERKKYRRSMLTEGGYGGEERSPGALEPARRGMRNDIDCGEVNDLDEKGKVTWEEIYGQTR